MYLPKTADASDGYAPFDDYSIVQGVYFGSYIPAKELTYTTAIGVFNGAAELTTSAAAVVALVATALAF